MKKIQRIIAILVVSVLAAVALTACGDDSKKATEGLEYKAMEDGTYAVTGYTGDAVDVYIPSEYNDIKVTVIEEEAFKGTEIQSISGGENLVYIGEDAFEKCYMLKSVDLSGPITKISYNAFSECTSLESVKLSKELKTIEDEAFYKCGNLKKIDFPESLEEIGEKAFYECDSLEKVTIPESVKSVDKMAFYTKDATVTFTVKGFIDGWSGDWCGNAEAIYEKKDTSAPKVNVKLGTYKLENTAKNEESFMQVREEGIQFFNRYKTYASRNNNLGYYTYEIVGNIIWCTSPSLTLPFRNMVYDEKSGTITGDTITGYKYTYTWVSDETTVEF